MTPELGCIPPGYAVVFSLGQHMRSLSRFVGGSRCGGSWLGVSQAGWFFDYQSDSEAGPIGPSIAVGDSSQVESSYVGLSS